MVFFFGVRTYLSGSEGIWRSLEIPGEALDTSPISESLQGSTEQGRVLLSGQTMLPIFGTTDIYLYAPGDNIIPLFE